MVLTPQLRQRIEMLQMTAMELSELIETEMVANPVLEEIAPGEEIQELSQEILDQNADGFDDFLNNGHPGDSRKDADDGQASDAGEFESSFDSKPARVVKSKVITRALRMRAGTLRMLLKRSISDESFRIISIPDIRPRRSNTRTMFQALSSSFRTSLR